MTLIVDYSRCTDVSDAEIERMESLGIALSVLSIPKLESLAHVTEAVARGEFYQRISKGALLYNADGESLSNTYRFWFRWLGLRVNCLKETRAQWLARMSRYIMIDIDRYVSQQEQWLSQELRQSRDQISQNLIEPSQL